MPGEGSIFQRRSDGRWVAQITSGSRDARTITRRYARTRTEARELLAGLRAGARKPSGSMPLGAFLERWVADARNIRPATRHGYQAVVTHHLVPTLGTVALADLSPIHVESMLTQLGPEMSPKSLRNVHAVLRRALGQAVRAGLVTRNVASREFVDAPRVPTVEPRAFTEAEVRALLAAASGDRLEAVFVVAVGTGLRQGELLGLAWRDIDLEGRRLHVRNELTRRAGRYELAEPKTERSRRTVPLVAGVVDALRAHRERLIADGFIPTSTGPVFVNLDGGPLSGSWVTHRLYQLEQAAGIPRLPFKNLRTTYSTRLHAAGVQDRDIADLMGHARTATTQRHYIASEGTSTAVLEALERLVG